MNGRWVCLDVGETLIDETRIWATWADVLGIPRLTLMAVLGAQLVHGKEHVTAFERFGFDEFAWRARIPEVEDRYAGFQPHDLYPDAVRAVAALRDAGYGVAVAANQPSVRAEELRRLGIELDVMAMSDTLGVAKPDPAFFARILELLGAPQPGDVAYVGDRVDIGPVRHSDCSDGVRSGMVGN
jgi:HAD superfamily hydrolase (TIGR01549 family)